MAQNTLGVTTLKYGTINEVINAINTYKDEKPQKKVNENDDNKAYFKKIFAKFLESLNEEHKKAFLEYFNDNKKNPDYWKSKFQSSRGIIPWWNFGIGALGLLAGIAATSYAINKTSVIDKNSAAYKSLFDHDKVIGHENYTFDDGVLIALMAIVSVSSLVAVVAICNQIYQINLAKEIEANTKELSNSIEEAKKNVTNAVNEQSEQQKDGKQNEQQKDGKQNDQQKDEKGQQQNAQSNVEQLYGQLLNLQSEKLLAENKAASERLLATEQKAAYERLLGDNKAASERLLGQKVSYICYHHHPNSHSSQLSKNVLLDEDDEYNEHLEQVSHASKVVTKQHFNKKIEPSNKSMKSEQYNHL